MTKRIYPSDLSDGEYKFLRKCLPTQKTFGRPRKHEWREIFNAVFYLIRTGCAWRYLPTDYPPWKSVYHYFRLWRRQNLFKRINHRLRRLVRKRVGRTAQSSAAILDSQSVKTGDTARGQVGFDSGKKVKGRKRHILVDTLGLLIAVVVHAASVSETAGGELVIGELAGKWWRLRVIWLDGGYFKRLFTAIENLPRWRKIRVEQVLRNASESGFCVLPKRWIVERTFGWLMKNRRMSKDYESLPETSEAMIYAAMIRLMLARLSG